MSERAVPYVPGRRWTFRMTWLRVLLLGILGMTAGLVVYRLMVGLAAPTNLTDRWPWALWTWWKLTGVALAGAGYSTAYAVHFLGQHRWRDIERGAFVVSLLGYLMVCAALILDLGQYYNAWRPVFFWGYHSVMFELFWCIGGYTVIQLVEFLYIFEERVPMPRFRPVLKKIYAPLLLVGAILPIFHQSALCSLYVIAYGRHDPIWWSMLLPLFAVITSFYVGPAVVTLENSVANRTYGRTFNQTILAQMTRVSAWIMVAYLALKIGDYAIRDVFPHLVDGSIEGNLALIELVVGVALPAALFLMPQVRASRGLLVTASLLAAFGVALNRFNIVITGMVDSIGEGWYVPHWMEGMFVLGLAAGVALVYLFIVENFPIYPESQVPVLTRSPLQGHALSPGAGATRHPGRVGVHAPGAGG